MRYFSALWARMYRLSANSRATISSTAIFLSQQSRQYFSSPRGSETSLAPHSAHRAFNTVFLGIHQFTIYNSRLSKLRGARAPADAEPVNRDGQGASAARRPEGHCAQRPRSRRDEAVLRGPAGVL